MDAIGIYAEKSTSRLEYACHIIFNLILKTDYSIYTSLEGDPQIHINYSSHPNIGQLSVLPSGLIEQEGIKDFDLRPGEWEGLKTIFHTGKGAISFDIFSAVFFLCSRYEEYLPFEGDEHGRFKAEDSVAFKYGFIREPIVEQWAQTLSALLNIPFPIEGYKYQLTVDVDSPWELKGRSMTRTIALCLRDLLFFKLNRLSLRCTVIAGNKKDPWDTFDYIDVMQGKLKEKVRFFFLMGNTHPFDSSISFRKKMFKELVIALQKKNKVGIHPSYASNDSEKILRKEYMHLARIVENKPLHSRQHYLKLQFPETFQRLIRLGVIEDYSLGWAGQIGFRTGCSRAVPFYDIEKEKQTHLMLVPLIVMDRTLKAYMKVDRETAIDEINALKEKVKAVGGQFTILFHNDALSDCGEWTGWRKVFETTIDPK